MKFGVTVALFLALLSVTLAFKSQTMLQTGQNAYDKFLDLCPQCTIDFWDTSRPNYAACCTGPVSCADMFEDISAGCWGYGGYEVDEEGNFIETDFTPGSPTRMNLRNTEVDDQ